MGLERIDDIVAEDVASAVSATSHSTRYSQDTASKDLEHHRDQGEKSGDDALSASSESHDSSSTWASDGSQASVITEQSDAVRDRGENGKTDDRASASSGAAHDDSGTLTSIEPAPTVTSTDSFASTTDSKSMQAGRTQESTLDASGHVVSPKRATRSSTLRTTAQDMGDSFITDSTVTSARPPADGRSSSSSRSRATASDSSGSRRRRRDDDGGDSYDDHEGTDGGSGDTSHHLRDDISDISSSNASELQRLRDEVLAKKGEKERLEARVRRMKRDKEAATLKKEKNTIDCDIAALREQMHQLESETEEVAAEAEAMVAKTADIARAAVASPTKQRQRPAVVEKDDRTSASSSPAPARANVRTPLQSKENPRDGSGDMHSPVEPSGPSSTTVDSVVESLGGEGALEQLFDAYVDSALGEYDWNSLTGKIPQSAIANGIPPGASRSAHSSTLSPQTSTLRGDDTGPHDGGT